MRNGSQAGAAIEEPCACALNLVALLASHEMREAQDARNRRNDDSGLCLRSSSNCYVPDLVNPRHLGTSYCVQYTASWMRTGGKTPSSYEYPSVMRRTNGQQMASGHTAHNRAISRTIDLASGPPSICACRYLGRLGTPVPAQRPPPYPYWECLPF